MPKAVQVNPNSRELLQKELKLSDRVINIEMGNYVVMSIYDSEKWEFVPRAVMHSDYIFLEAEVKYAWSEVHKESLEEFFATFDLNRNLNNYIDEDTQPVPEKKEVVAELVVHSNEKGWWNS